MTAEREAILAEARSWIGTPYGHQASLKGVGADCLGLVRGVYRALHGEEPEAVPPYTEGWGELNAGEELAAAASRHLVERDLKAAEPGDVLLFRVFRSGPAKHLGILSGPQRMIHAYSGQSVAETSLTPWWHRRLVAAYAFPIPRD